MTDLAEKQLEWETKDIAPINLRGNFLSFFFFFFPRVPINLCHVSKKKIEFNNLVQVKYRVNTLLSHLRQTNRYRRKGVKRLKKFISLRMKNVFLWKFKGENNILSFNNYSSEFQYSNIITET